MSPRGSPPVSQSSQQSSHVAGSAWYIPISLLGRRSYGFEYQFGGALGEGGYGKILLAMNIDARLECAVKAIAMRRLRNRREAASISNEVKTLSAIQANPEFPFLMRPAIQNNWYFQYRGNIHLILEYCPGGDLARNPAAQEELRDPQCFKLMSAEVLLGILALHDMGIIHHDIKPSNILIDRAGHCVITDFGGAGFVANGRYGWKANQTPIFTLRYAAPDIIINGPAGRDYGFGVDFWSLGVTLFELITGQDFITDADDDHIAYILQEGLVDLTRLPALIRDTNLCSLVQGLLTPDGRRRLQGSAVREHRYFSSFLPADWISVQRRERPPFRNSRPVGVNPRNTSYDYVERSGERGLPDANLAIVERWLVEEGVGMPRHKDETSR